MDSYELYNELQDLLINLDADELPELHNYLTSIMDEENGVEEDAYNIANAILDCDRPEPLPSIVRDLIIELFNLSFEQGNAEAMNDLGAHYYDGSRGFEQSFEKSVECYHLAAQNGSRHAQENLGYCYYYGRNMPVDYEKAFHYFALGAFDGHLISLYKIGDMYAAGHYVQKNEKEAFLIYMHCINTMSEEAEEFVAGPVFLRLGKCFLYGIGTEKNAKSALVCYQKAESYLYDMVKRGDVMYKKSLLSAISGQEKARKALENELPDAEWIFD